jgi:hypothetical protein
VKQNRMPADTKAVIFFAGFEANGVSTDIVL